MKELVKVLGYAKPYWRYALANLIFNLLGIVAGLFSIGLLFPFLEVLFYGKQAPAPGASLAFDTQSLLNFISYKINILMQEKGSRYALAFICVLVVIFTLLKNLFRYLAIFFMVPLRSHTIQDLRLAVYKKLLRLPLSYFSDERKGDLMTRMSHDVQELEYAIVNSLEAVFKEPITIVVYLTALVAISPSLTLFIFLLLPVTALIIARVGRSIKREAGKGQSSLASLMSLIEETLGGMRVVKAFNLEPRFLSRFMREHREVTRLSIYVNRIRDVSSPLSETLGVTVLAIVLWYGGSLVLSGQSSLKPGLFITFIAIFSQIIQPAKAFSAAFYGIQKGAASAARLEEILNTEERILEAPDALALKGLSDHIEYRNVHFAYGDKPVLADINLKIKRGTMVALVGPSGSGKSTLADLVPRFHDVKAGSILIDGMDVRQVKMTDLRDLMGVVSQESILFNDTVSGNIAYGKKGATRDEVMEAAKVANAHEFIQALENGYDTNIGERGSKLSGGQRQRISIARAVLKNPQILILDEATSALDSESEKLVQEALNRLMSGRTSLVIAHRLSTIRRADLIVVLDEGRIVETGTHDELMNRPSRYRNLVEMQGMLGES